MRTKLIVQVLMTAAITSLLGYLINQLPAVPDLPHKNEIIAGAVVVITLIAAAIAFWQNSQPEEQTVITEQPQQNGRSRSESLLLQAVKQEVISRLAQSLHNAVFINLNKQAQPQQVRRRLDAEVKVGSQSPEPLSAETSILEVFDRPGIDGRLLILGEPGAGKTTTMLDLAKGLCDRAEQDATAFIPVLLNLSSWKDPKQTMTTWLVEELKSKYGVRKDIGTKWLAEKQLLPVLDGLDEVKPEHQEGCVQAINRWLESEDSPPSLAVCCRQEEYEKVVRERWQAEAEEHQDETQIHLNGAILLRTLTDEQIQTYLTAANQPELWQMLQQDYQLWALIRTPLWLSITILTYAGRSISHWQHTPSTDDQRLTLLMDNYVQRMLHRQLKSRAYSKSKPPTAKQTRRWLIYLAQQLPENLQTEFLIEEMQPNWLSYEQELAYGVIDELLYVLIVGWYAGLTNVLFLEPTIGLTIGLISGLLCGLIDWLGGCGRSGRWIGVQNRMMPDQGIIQSAKIALGLITIAIVIDLVVQVLLLKFFRDFVQFGLMGVVAVSVVSISFGWLVWLSFQKGGGQDCFRHFTLRFILFRSGSIPWNYARFLDYCTERLLLQRVGGRYRFIHKSLQEHFAEMRE